MSGAERKTDIELCHCGRPLHYKTDRAADYMRRLVDELGPLVAVSVEGRTWLVQRHYVALHGLKAKELPMLGFEELLP
jgi:hypothetical protein